MSRFWIRASLTFLLPLWLEPDLVVGDNLKAQVGVIDAGRRAFVSETESDPQKVAELVFMAGFSTAKARICLPAELFTIFKEEKKVA